jgi:glycerol-3-phosphate acyltransferase PlsY
MGGGLPDSAVTALVIAGGYIAGSMPFGYWLVRLVKHDDIRRHGSGNIGATNVWRVYGRWLGLPVILLDALKGFVPLPGVVRLRLRRSHDDFDRLKWAGLRR